MLAGRIDVQVDGWPMSFVAEGKNLILNAGGFRQLLTLQRRWKGLFKPLRQCFTRADIHLLLQTHWLGRIELLPNPPYVVRMLLERD